MRLPEVQEELLLITKELGSLSRRLKKLSNEISRRPPLKRGPVVSARMTPAIKNTIIAMFDRGHSQTEIARDLNINAARVSETLRGHRK